MVSIDVAGAFDSARWHHILASLKKKKVPKNIYVLIQSYLSDRRVVAQVGDTIVERIATQGIMQGSPFGPTLWNVFYDDLIRIELNDHYFLQAYADDLVLITGTYPLRHNPNICEELATNALNQLYNKSREAAGFRNVEGGANVLADIWRSGGNEPLINIKDNPHNHKCQQGKCDKLVNTF